MSILDDNIELSTQKLVEVAIKEYILKFYGNYDAGGMHKGYNKSQVKIESHLINSNLIQDIKFIHLYDNEDELNNSFKILTYYGWAEFKDSDINSRYIVKFWSQNKWYAWGSEVTVYYVPSIYKDDYYVIGKWKGGMTRMNMIKFVNKIKKCQRTKQQSLSMDKDMEKENWLKSFVGKCW